MSFEQSEQSRAEILAKLAADKGQTFPPVKKNDGSILKERKENLVDSFATNFYAINGNLFLCLPESEILLKLKELLTARFQALWCFEAELQTVLNNLDIPFSSTIDTDIDRTAVLSKCEYLISKTGSVVIASNDDICSSATVFPTTHIVLAKKEQIIDEVGDGIHRIIEKHKSLPPVFSIISGPARTADIEKTLIIGAHGPRELMVFCIDGETTFF